MSEAMDRLVSVNVIPDDPSIPAIPPRNPWYLVGSNGLSDAPAFGTGGSVAFGAVACTVVAIVPTHGTASGGTHVVIQVDDSTGCTSAAIDGTNITGFAIDDATHVSGNTVAHASGALDVTVTNAAGASAPLVGGYTYDPLFTDPALESLTSWLKTNIGTAPWVDAASAGVSGAQQEAQLGGTPASLVNRGGITAITYGQVSATSGILQTTIGATSDIGTYLNISHYTVMGLIYLASASAFQAGTPYQNRCVLCADARWGITLSTSGLGVWHYTGSFPSHNEPMSTGAWHFFCVRYDAGTGLVQIDIDNVPGTPTAIGAFAAFSPISAFIHNNNFTSGSTAEWSIRERRTNTIRESDAVRDNYYAYLKFTYPLAGLP